MRPPSNLRHDLSKHNRRSPQPHGKINHQTENGSERYLVTNDYSKGTFDKNFDSIERGFTAEDEEDGVADDEQEAVEDYGQEDDVLSRSESE